MRRQLNREGREKNRKIGKIGSRKALKKKRI